MKNLSLLVVLACIGVASCFNTPDPGKLKCNSNAGCPTDKGYICSGGKCVKGSGAGGANASTGGAGGGGARLARTRDPAGSRAGVGAATRAAITRRQRLGQPVASGPVAVEGSFIDAVAAAAAAPHAGPPKTPRRAEPNSPSTELPDWVDGAASSVAGGVAT